MSSRDRVNPGSTDDLTRSRAYAPDTIAALATPPGRGGVGIIRVSGPATAAIAGAVLGELPRPRHAEYRPFYDNADQAIDTGLALWFPAPHSFTGEDVLELQGHGGPVVMDMLLARVIALGARLARPGEFSERAYLNDKLDLAQAEAVADLIEAGSEQAARSAQRSLQGVFSEWIHSVVEQLTELRIYVEAAIDFPEEEIDFLSDRRVTEQLAWLQRELNEVIKQAHQGQLLREGMRIVLAGRPNTGKSSLLNALAGRESAIVTHIAGTTRDVLREEISIDGLPLHIIDTAGLREGGDEVERLGMERTWQAIEQADRVLLLIDDRQGFGEPEQQILQQLPAHLPVTRVYNKIDLTGQAARLDEDEQSVRLYLSATGQLGIDLLRDHLKACVGYTPQGEGMFMARRRHVDALQRADELIANGTAQLSEHGAGELLAEDLRQAQQVLGEITGEVSSDDLLGKIFSSFCIGK
ncbi:tRNA modification GTPase trmE [Thiohalophilus thiocyanatoxydans]|uniref:tRNA modification GTPase MnmE n=1 Tax=Thiohalophilus thiocyanatoxydans TaxID=381308 RepID=A0A4R8IS57_9GAMM|nr:tRNA uridine-5-carboxymethylaminomethyl(34) synthesis GTPase MnmE [Thiohalophilus thiocyanatoxydans]TDY03871.1 tRNA modification GTPase trmE [Thiohalophilus thiocyanatoxydans]